ncbi:MAG: cytochrome c biogenesis protein CcsA [Clostridiales bacterium]|nr:cytochrome c biogenesis protein CcsA [Clostridiales bacterium]
MPKTTTFALLLWLLTVTTLVFTIVPPALGLGYLVRIMFFHIPMAWVAVLGFLLSAWWAIRYLRTKQMRYHLLSSSAARLGLIFCLLATGSGAIFAKLTWGAYWNWDPRQTTIFILLLIYGAYISLEASVEDPVRRANAAAVYTLFSFITVPFLVFIIPRFFESLHPEPLINNAGKIQMDSIMIGVLLAALAGITGLFLWLLQYWMKRRTTKVRE